MKQKQVKGRDSKASPNTAGPARKAVQEAAAEINKATVARGGLTLWDKAKIRRRQDRIHHGKTEANWRKRQAEASKYKSNGKNAITQTP